MIKTLGSPISFDGLSDILSENDSELIPMAFTDDSELHYFDFDFDAYYSDQLNTSSTRCGTPIKTPSEALCEEEVEV